jgi:SAM-dependent methyltransferase
MNCAKQHEESDGVGMKKAIGSIVRPLLQGLFGIEAVISRAWVSGAHRRLMWAQWCLGTNPEFFDHHIDLYYQWTETRNSMWVERGAFGSLALKGGDVLEIACGDGFNSKNFYSLRSKNVIACDFDPDAIATAKRNNAAPNVTHLLADIRTAMPQGTFDNVVWDAAIEHFTPDEIAKIMADIKARLTPDGILSGYTLVEKEDGSHHLHQHEYEFRDMEDLARFLRPHFKNVRVFETVYPDRHNLYFWASDGVVPFDPDWSHQVS